jgi:hypothetical protein
MKPRYLGLTVLSGWLLAGCTVPLLQDMNANLKSVNASLKNVNADLRGSTGMPSTTVADVDADVCDPVAFKAGFQDQYVINWNQTVGNQESIYRLISQQHPENAAAHHNYELYRGKRLSGKGIGQQMEYRVQFDNQGRILNYCQSNSYMKGESAGIRAAGQDLKALRDQELEISSL